MTAPKRIQIADLVVSNEGPFTLFGGMNVLESRELALEVAAAYKEVTSKLGILTSSRHPSTKQTALPSLPFGAPDWKRAWKSFPRSRRPTPFP